MCCLLGKRWFSLANQLECFSVPLVVLEHGFKTKFVLELFRCQGIIDRFYQEVSIIWIGPYLHTAWISIHDFIWNAVVEIVMRDHKVWIDITIDYVYVSICFDEDSPTWIDDSGFVGANGGYDVILVQVRIDLEGEPSIVG